MLVSKVCTQRLTEGIKTINKHVWNYQRDWRDVLSAPVAAAVMAAYYYYNYYFNTSSRALESDCWSKTRQLLFSSLIHHETQLSLWPALSLPFCRASMLKRRRNWSARLASKLVCVSESVKCKKPDPSKPKRSTGKESSTSVRKPSKASKRWCLIWSVCLF